MGCRLTRYKLMDWEVLEQSETGFGTGSSPAFCKKAAGKHDGRVTTYVATRPRTRLTGVPVVPGSLERKPALRRVGQRHGARGLTSGSREEVLDPQGDPLAWQAAGIQEYIVQARIDLTEKKLNGFTSANQVIAFIKECAAQIPQQETRQGVLFLMAAVCNADGEVNEAEKQVLGNYALAFDIGMQTVANIANAARTAKF